MKTDNFLYSLNTEDIQLLAVENIDRELTDDEIEKVKEAIAENINWYEAILFAISEKIRE